MKIVEQLAAAQIALKAPKGQHNNFGNYNYRSCEDILEALKPILKENALTLTLDDAIESAGTRIYVKATARLQNADGEFIENHAFARESEIKKGMDDSQITGAASSYARKYALNGMFLIDDTKDADTDEFGKLQQQPDKQPKYISKVDQASLQTELLRVGGSVPQWIEYLSEKFPKNPPKSLDTITPQQYEWSMNSLEKSQTKAVKS